MRANIPCIHCDDGVMALDGRPESKGYREVNGQILHRQVIRLKCQSCGAIEPRRLEDPAELPPNGVGAMKAAQA